VALSGEYAIVGAAEEDGVGYPRPDAGATYVFHRTRENTWDIRCAFSKFRTRSSCAALRTPHGLSS
jgi:hypothetical protein